MRCVRTCLTALAACAAIATPAAALGAVPAPAPAAPAPAAPAPAPPAPPAPPAQKRIAPGVTAGGIDVGNLTLAEAAARLQEQAGPALRHTVKVRVAGHTMRMSMRSIKLAFDAERSARRAYIAGRKAARARPVPAAPPGVELAVTFRRAAVRDFAERLDERTHIAPRNASVRITLRRILRRHSRTGRDLDAKALRASIEGLLADPAAIRELKPGRKPVAPKVTAADLPRAYSTVVTVDRSNFKLRLFKRLKLVKTYGIAVGAAGYDTPIGLYSITNKAVNPTWSAPDRPWAGLYRGRTVGGGAPDNPLKARWLGIVNGVGIHGTGDAGSIGSAASHGCIRMTVPSVIELYSRVPVGTPVLIH